MLTLLIAVNIVLIAVVVFLATRKRPGGGNILADMENDELIEFQQNLRELIGELNRISKDSIEKMNASKKDIDSSVSAADLKIRELKYLVERHRLMRGSSYREEIAKGPENSAAQGEGARGSGKISGINKKNRAKFVINDKEKPEEEERGSRELPEKKEGRQKQDKYGHIKSLISGGMSVEEIARVTGLTKGEIELIINIKK